MDQQNSSGGSQFNVAAMRAAWIQNIGRTSTVTSGTTTPSVTTSPTVISASATTTTAVASTLPVNSPSTASACAMTDTTVVSLPGLSSGGAHAVRPTTPLLPDRTDELLQGVLNQLNTVVTLLTQISQAARSVSHVQNVEAPAVGQRQPSTNQPQPHQQPNVVPQDDVDSSHACGVCREEAQEVIALEPCGHYPYCRGCVDNMVAAHGQAAEGLFQCPHCQVLVTAMHGVKYVEQEPVGPAGNNL